MASRAVRTFGKAGGAGAKGSEEGAGGKPTTLTEDVGAEDDGEQAARAAADKALMSGGPGDDSGEGQTQSFKFKYKDKEFATEEDLTAYLDTLDTDLTNLRSRAEPVRQQPVVTPPDQSKKPTSQEMVSLLLSDPEKVFEGIKSDLRKEYAQAEQSRTNMRNWWDQFWVDNKELQPYKAVVDMVFNSNMAELGPLEMGPAAKRLAELSRSTVLSINKEALGGKDKSNRPATNRVVLEGAGSPSPRSRDTVVDFKPKSLTQIIKDRAKQRRGKTA